MDVCVDINIWKYVSYLAIALLPILTFYLLEYDFNLASDRCYAWARSLFRSTWGPFLKKS